MKLHGYWRSSASWRVRIALAHKGLAYEYVPVHLVRGGGEQHSEAHRAKNPMAQVPVLELDDGTMLSQSLAIIEWLEETHPTPPLLPKDPVARARARQLAEMVNAGIQPLQNIGVQQHLVSLGLGVDEKAWTVHWIRRGLGALEAVAKNTAGRFCVGDAVSVADACLVPQLYGARRFAIDVADYPTLARIEEACAALPAFAAAHADRQPDAVPA
ncbi:maleylacetoacetate isomerase [Vulgatibacter incomptus]|uniref:Maleylacetoacetate isomerase n=1 Tax=Vulgatibacter incomptus TaxID=1391653 RepID=A0A0K1PIX4_9BACT|nr:maleylacetoacetate isomerase [Vulgatibacter incomptus]AKU93059.1 Maleylacetoacetate isomerase [Vulgatibacter incomptus]